MRHVEKKNFYKIIFLDSYKNFYNKSAVRKSFLAISAVTRSNVKLALRAYLIVFLKSVFRPKNTFKCLHDKKMCLVIFSKAFLKVQKNTQSDFFLRST